VEGRGYIGDASMYAFLLIYEMGRELERIYKLTDKEVFLCYFIGDFEYRFYYFILLIFAILVSFCFFMFINGTETARKLG
jgi:hypothetical protein